MFLHEVLTGGVTFVIDIENNKNDGFKMMIFKIGSVGCQMVWAPMGVFNLVVGNA